jgi:hypothetical protein
MTTLDLFYVPSENAADRFLLSYYTFSISDHVYVVVAIRTRPFSSSISLQCPNSCQLTSHPSTLPLQQLPHPSPALKPTSLYTTIGIITNLLLLYFPPNSPLNRFSFFFPQATICTPATTIKNSTLQLSPLASQIPTHASVSNM